MAVLPLHQRPRWHAAQSNGAFLCARCLAPLPNRPSAKELLEDAFFQKKVDKAPSQKKLALESPAVKTVPTATGTPLVLQPPDPSHRTSFSSDDAPGATCEVGRPLLPACKQALC